jgi:cellulose synthase/poly-beta-1,6-N-acetylglucosamine synthase-like glycosyltransferase
MYWTIAAALSLLIWLYLVFAHGGFWRVRPAPQCNLRAARRVVAVIPARNEADVIGKALTSLFTQYFVAPLQIVLVDDASTDGTADVARATAQKSAGQKTLPSSPALPCPTVGPVNFGLSRKARKKL